MVHENVCVEATDVKRALFDICALSYACARVARICMCIACMRVYYVRRRVVLRAKRVVVHLGASHRESTYANFIHYSTAPASRQDNPRVQA